jgi:uncharacterized protein (DUF1810 family)
MAKGLGSDTNDPYDLERFLRAQEGSYAAAIEEIRSGRKRSHWMWYVFPQIDGLGYSATARHYAIGSLGEARAYLRHPVLGTRLRECAEALLGVAGKSAAEIFGYPDELKLKSSMTLFARASKDLQGSGDPDVSPPVFNRVLDRYYRGQADVRTLEILARLEAHQRHGR